MQRISTEEKSKFAALMINEGKIENLDSLYRYLPKRVVAEILGVNKVSFTNFKSNEPGEFKMADFVKLSTALNVSLDTILKIFKNSLPVDILQS